MEAEPVQRLQLHLSQGNIQLLVITDPSVSVHVSPGEAAGVAFLKSFQLWEHRLQLLHQVLVPWARFFLAS